jgi:PEP-CTERM motif
MKQFKIAAMSATFVAFGVLSASVSTSASAEVFKFDGAGEITPLLAAKNCEPNAGVPGAGAFASYCYSSLNYAQGGLNLTATGSTVGATNSGVVQDLLLLAGGLGVQSGPTDGGDEINIGQTLRLSFGTRVVLESLRLNWSDHNLGNLFFNATRCAQFSSPCNAMSLSIDGGAPSLFDLGSNPNGIPTILVGQQGTTFDISYAGREPFYIGGVTARAPGGSSVPEPTSLALIGLAFAGMARYRRKS